MKKKKGYLLGRGEKGLQKTGERKDEWGLRGKIEFSSEDIKVNQNARKGL